MNGNALHPYHMKLPRLVSSASSTSALPCPPKKQALKANASPAVQKPKKSERPNRHTMATTRGFAAPSASTTIRTCVWQSCFCSPDSRIWWFSAPHKYLAPPMMQVCFLLWVELLQRQFNTSLKIFLTRSVRPAWVACAVTALCCWSVQQGLNS